MATQEELYKMKGKIEITRVRVIDAIEKYKSERKDEIDKADENFDDILDSINFERRSISTLFDEILNLLEIYLQYSKMLEEMIPSVFYEEK